MVYIYGMLWYKETYDVGYFWVQKAHTFKIKPSSKPHVNVFA